MTKRLRDGGVEGVSTRQRTRGSWSWFESWHNPSARDWTGLSAQRVTQALNVGRHFERSRGGEAATQ